MRCFYSFTMPLMLLIFLLILGCSKDTEREIIDDTLSTNGTGCDIRSSTSDGESTSIVRPGENDTFRYVTNFDLDTVEWSIPDNVGITILGRPDNHSISLKFESSFTGATISAHGVGVDDRIQCRDSEELRVP